IRDTFASARQALAADKIYIKNDPCDPQASIMAGTWYLSRMFDQAVADGYADRRQRQQLEAWQRPLEYYYAGPGNGRKAGRLVRIRRSGHDFIIDKQAYAEKVLKEAAAFHG
ncbi:MAG: hypothetical protein JXR89_01150, partial [Deltaproteobacteria bacterium]|nr:hypothetical protein [Deltaproteobacteria bacterium]